MVNRYYRNPREALMRALSGGVKAKPHSTKEGRKAAAGRKIRRIVESQTSPFMPIKPKFPKWKKVKG